MGCEAGVSVEDCDNGDVRMDSSRVRWYCASHRFVDSCWDPFDVVDGV